MISRRVFLKNASLATAGLALGAGPLHAESLFEGGQNQKKKTTSGDKIKLACIGIGNRGRQDIEAFEKTGLVEIVALCDVDLEGKQCEWALSQYPKAIRCNDWRDLFEKYGSKFEAVCIATPDHTHFPISMLALSEGKHVYCEKPMCRTFFECELLMEAARKRGSLVTQIGNQGHSDANYYQFKAWTEAGIIKDITAITAHMNSSRRWHGFDPKMKHLPEAEPLPAGMNWDAWLGPTPWHDYSSKYHQGNWRCWYDLGMGALGDWAMHLVDTAHEFLELGLPYEVSLVDSENHNEFFYPYSSTILFRFGPRKGMPPVEMTWYDGLKNLPPLPAGYGESEFNPNVPATNQGAYQRETLNPGSILYGKDLTFKRGSHAAITHIIPESKEKEMEAKGLLPSYEVPSDHFENFLHAIQGTEKANSAFDKVGELSEVLCLGVIAQRMNAQLYFDPRTKQFTNNAFANAMLAGVPPRCGWEWLYKL